MGLDFMEVKDFIEEKGIVEYNHELIFDYLKDRNYINKLKPKKNNVPQQQHAYQYYDPDAQVNPSPQKQTKTVQDTDCRICFDKKIDVVLTPCGHHCLCQNCANLVKSKNQGCPICRKKIDQVVKVYAS